MFINSEIKNGFAGMIGIYQSSADFPQLNSDLTDSDYGYFIQDFHPVFTHENFYNCINGLKDSTDETYSAYFTRKLEYAYVNSVRQVVQRKLSNLSGGHTVINKLSLYDGRGTTETIAKRNRFVGYKVYLTKENLKFVLESVAIQLTQNQTLNVYIYKANEKTPVAVIPINYANTMDMQLQHITSVNITNDITTNEYIVGYYESDLTGFAIKRDIDVIKMQPNCCNNNSYSYWQKYNKFVNFRSFYVEEAYLSQDKSMSWNVNREVITNNTNYGLNMTFSVVCDITPLVIKQKSLFVELVKDTLIVHLLKDLFHTQENNQIANFLRGFLGRQPFNEFIKPYEDKLKKTLEETALDITSLDSVCLPNSYRSKKVRTGSL